MKTLLAILTILASANVYSGEKAEPQEKKVPSQVEKVCNSLTETYLTAFQKSSEKVNYTDLLFSVATKYSGDDAGLYLIMHTIESAYNDDENKIERFHGAADFKKRCLTDELINMIQDDAKKNPKGHIEEKILTSR